MRDQDTILLESIYKSMAGTSDKPLAPANFLGWQETGDGGYLELWNLVADVGDHTKDSTVTRQTLEGHGFRVPEAPFPPER